MDFMAKVEINEYTPAGMVFVGGALTAIVGLVNLLTGEDSEDSLLMLVIGLVIAVVGLCLILKPRRRRPVVQNGPVFGTGRNQPIRTPEELYFRVCNHVADLHAVPRLQWTYGHENLRQWIRQDHQFAVTLFQKDPSLDVLQYIYSIDEKAAYTVCLFVANALSWHI